MSSAVVRNVHLHGIKGPSTTRELRYDLERGVLGRMEPPESGSEPETSRIGIEKAGKMIRITNRESRLPRL
jgi:hypothetical protein